jgi:hypothetical protein
MKMPMMSPGVQVNEIDLSIVVPALGNATAAFAGVFTKGPSDKYLLITNAEELIQYYGEPTNDNYNDWFQCYNFLQYANKLLVSRAVDTNGTLEAAEGTGGVNVTTAAQTAGDTDITLSEIGNIEVGDLVTFDANTLDAVKVEAISGSIITLAEAISEDLIEGSIVYIKDQAFNALATVAAEGETTFTSAELKSERLLVQNEDEYGVKADAFHADLGIDTTQPIKFIAKSSGKEMNGIEVAIARAADFETGLSYAFDGILLNDLFEFTPNESNEEIALIVRKEGEIDMATIVSLKEGAKDYRNKSIFIEDVLYQYSSLVYARVNPVAAMPEARLEVSERKDAIEGNPNVVVTNKTPIQLVLGSDGSVNHGDIQVAYGSVYDNTIFGNKEELDIDIVIANEQARVAAATLASERADCIGFLGASYDEVVGLPSAKIVENLNNVVLTGELNNGAVANSFNAFFGNYKYQYDKYNDKFRWVSVAGDVAGLRSDTNTKLDTWWASAGLDRGQIKNAQKVAFNPNQGQRDLLYKNRVNPVVSFPGQGNAIVWGQKTLQSKPSAFDRINVRGLFNTLERAIARMAKYYLFEFNDQFTRNRFVGTIKPFMDNVKAGRGCYDYYIRCDETNNTPYIIDTNQFVADIAVKPTRVAEFITLNFIAVGTGVSFGEIFV